MSLRFALPCLALLALAALGGPACAPSAALRPTVDVPLRASEPSPEVDVFVESFFREGPASPHFAEELRGALAKHPASGALHEVAAYWARLAGDDHDAWQHFLLAAADTHHSGALLDIEELDDQNLTGSEQLTTIQTLQRVAAAHPDANARARATRALAMRWRLTGRVDEARRANAELRFLPSFQVIGAFENDDGKGLDEAYPPEAKIDLAASTPGAVVPVSWRKVDVVDSTGALPLGGVVHPRQQAVAYAAVWLHVPAATPADLRITTSAPVAAWVNHARVVREDRIRGWGFDNARAPVSLRAGWNELLVKSAVRSGAWNLNVRLTDGAGNPLPGLVSATTPASISAAPAPPALAPSPAPRVTLGSRDAFAAARTLVLHGLEQPGGAAFVKLQDAARANVVLRYFTADAAARDHQTERALDALTSSISDRDAYPALLTARARIYLQKGLLDQAEHDLERAVLAQPEARLARMDLADVLAQRRWNGDAVNVLAKVVARWPDSAFAHARLASIREAQGYLAEAEAEYRRAVAIEPGDVRGLRLLRSLADRREERDQVDSLFERIEVLAPIDVDDQLARADAQRRRGHFAAADASLRALSLFSPDQPTAYARRAQIAEETGRFAEALALYARAEERDPHDVWLAERLRHLRPAADDVLAPYIPTDADVDAAAHASLEKRDAASHVDVLLLDEATLLNTDGSVRVVHTEVLRPVSQRGRDELVRIHLPAGGHLRVLKAFAQTKDGTRQEASSVEQSSVRFRNLDVGSTVVLQYAFYPARMGALAEDFYADWPFGAVGRHVLRERWTLLAPRTKTLHVDVEARVKHTSRASGPWVVHDFVAENEAALPSEPNMVPVADTVPHAVVTTLASWDSFIRWERAILQESFAADPKVDALAATLTLGATTPRERLARLFAFVAQEIRYQQEYESILAGWQPHRSSVVLERKYGDCKDKATLLIALARAVGIEVRFAVLATHGVGHPDRNVVLPTFNHAIAYVPAQAGLDAPLFLDATVDALDLWNLRGDDQGAAALVVDPASWQWSWVDVPYRSSAEESESAHVEISLASPESVRAKVHVELRGAFASRGRVALRSEDQARQVFDLLTSAAFRGAKLVSASAPDHESMLHPLAIDLDIDATESLTREGNHYRLKLMNAVDNAATSLRDRQTPLDLGPPKSSKTTFVLHVGSGVRLVDAPIAVDVVDPCFHAKRAVRQEKTNLTIEDEYESRCTRVEVADYARYRANSERARSLFDAAIVFDGADAMRASLAK